MKLTDEQWDLGHLHGHLQAAAELEAWTIPYYLSAMFSVVDRSSEAYQLVQSVVNQEMLHLQLVSNIANSYGYSTGADARHLQLRRPRTYRTSTSPLTRTTRSRSSRPTAQRSVRSTNRGSTRCA